MQEGDRIYTPRFCTVRISEVFQNEKDARFAGFVEPTHYYDDPEFGILGKSIDLNRMIFAAYKK